VDRITGLARQWPLIPVFEAMNRDFQRNSQIFCEFQTKHLTLCDF